MASPGVPAVWSWVQRRSESNRRGMDMLPHEKADQAQSLLAETGLDCWLTFVRETELRPDPGVEQVVGAGAVRNSAFHFGAGGKRVAIVANFDTSAVQVEGVFREVVGYDEDIRGPLKVALRRFDPRQIELNYSLDDVPVARRTAGDERPPRPPLVRRGDMPFADGLLTRRLGADGLDGEVVLDQPAGVDHDSRVSSTGSPCSSNRTRVKSVTLSTRFRRGSRCKIALKLTTSVAR